ncbi:MAG: hypothetical protein R2857_01185 [Vampirovibrionales bacterium]
MHATGPRRVGALPGGRQCRAALSESPALQANGQPRYAIGEYQSAIRLKPSAEMTAVVYNNMAYCFALIQY